MDWINRIRNYYFYFVLVLCIYSVLNLSPGNKLQVLVTAVDSLSLFYAQAVKNEERLV